MKKRYSYLCSDPSFEIVFSESEAEELEEGGGGGGGGGRRG